MRYKEINWTEKFFFFALALTALVILCSPYLIRSASEQYPVIGDDTYYNIISAQKIRAGESGEYGFFPYILAYSYLPLDLAAIVIPIAFGVISIILFFLILQEAGLPKNESFISSFILAITPAFLV